MLPGVDTTIDRLKADRFKIIVVTNQPDVAAGVQKLSVVDEIHESLHASLGIDNISACYHVGADNYDCRTPKPGGLVPAAEKHNIGLSRSFFGWGLMARHSRGQCGRVPCAFHRFRLQIIPVHNAE